MSAIGIDLGTTNSVGAYYDADGVHILTSSRGDGIVPSVVMYKKPRKGSDKGEILVGEPAVNYAFRDPTNAILSIKRLMGRNYDEPKVTELQEHISFDVAQAAGDNPGVCVRLGDDLYTPVQISSMILGQIKQYAEQSLGTEVTHAVITVPAYFEERQRAATRQAGELAGLVVKKIIDEPSAAAVAYGVEVGKGQRQRLLVFDLGGGTFDVSIIMTTLDPKGKNHFEVLEITGDNWLGGDDFDREIVRIIMAAVEEQYGFDAFEDRAFQLQAKQAAERAKIELTTSEQADIILPAACKTPDGDFLDLDLTVTRAEFEERVQPYVDRCMKEVRTALNLQGLTPEDIDRVLLVGGSTKVPVVQQAVASYFGKEKVQQLMNPYHAVAMGAGILAATLKGIQCPACGHLNDESLDNCEKCNSALDAAISAGDISVGETTAMSFGINAVRDGRADSFEVIIPKGTPYPLKKPMTQRFKTTKDNFLRIHVYEGNNEVASENEEQGVVEVNEDDFKKENVAAPAGTDVEVTMNYNRDRELFVDVRIPDTTFQKTSKLRRDRATSRQQQQDDKWKDELEKLVQIAEHFRGKYMGFMEPREQSRLDNEIDRAQKALDSGNAVEGRAAVRRVAGAIDACGVASLLFLADRVQSGAKTERARKINEVVNEIRGAWWNGEKDKVNMLTRPLRAVVAAELNSRRGEGQVAGQDEFGGALKVH